MFTSRHLAEVYADELTDEANVAHEVTDLHELARLIKAAAGADCVGVDIDTTDARYFPVAVFVERVRGLPVVVG